MTSVYGFRNSQRFCVLQSEGVGRNAADDHIRADPVGVEFPFHLVIISVVFCVQPHQDADCDRSVSHCSVLGVLGGTEINVGLGNCTFDLSDLLAKVVRS